MYKCESRLSCLGCRLLPSCMGYSAPCWQLQLPWHAPECFKECFNALTMHHQCVASEPVVKNANKFWTKWYFYADYSVDRNEQFGQVFDRIPFLRQFCVVFSHFARILMSWTRPLQKIGNWELTVEGHNKADEIVILAVKALTLKVPVTTIDALQHFETG